MVQRDKAPDRVERTGPDSLPCRCPCSCVPWPVACASWPSHAVGHRIRHRHCCHHCFRHNSRTGWCRSHRHRSAGRRQNRTACRASPVCHRWWETVAGPSAGPTPSPAGAARCTSRSVCPVRSPINYAVVCERLHTLNRRSRTGM
uniref:Uncharacterized protein n=1 Tax=Anopheles atroparvus TaxID=41427 RepID=A0AAG5DYT2_ANOAO